MKVEFVIDKRMGTAPLTRASEIEIQSRTSYQTDGTNSCSSASVGQC